jgi:HAD superfamily hydrolase (TIGR01509 family)
MGYDITEDMVIKTLGLNVENTKRILSHCLGEAFDFSTARKIRVDYVTSYIENNGLPIKTGLMELLDYLNSNHYKITIVTSSEEERARYYLDQAGISDVFDEIVCGDMIEKGKPEPDIYAKASVILGLYPNECLALEDSPLGILSAFRAGLKPVMIPDLLQPDEETNRLLFAKLPSLLEVITLVSKPENTG